MTHRIALAVGWTVVACGIVLNPTVASAAEDASTCQDDMQTSGPIVSDRVEQAFARCMRNATDGQELAEPELSARAVTLADCVLAAREGGFRPADRLEHDIVLCMAASIDQAGTW